MRFTAYYKPFLWRPHMVYFKSYIVKLYFPGSAMHEAFYTGDRCVFFVFTWSKKTPVPPDEQLTKQSFLSILVNSLRDGVIDSLKIENYI